MTKTKDVETLLIVADFGGQDMDAIAGGPRGAGVPQR